MEDIERKQREREGGGRTREDIVRRREDSQRKGRIREFSAFSMSVIDYDRTLKKGCHAMVEKQERKMEGKKEREKVKLL